MTENELIALYERREERFEMREREQRATLKKIGDWILSHETGASSLAMAAVFLGSENTELNYPHDPSDFRRCHSFMVNCIPFECHASVLYRLGKQNEKWAIIEREWSTLTAHLFQEIKGEKAPKLYKYMQRIGL